jgi:purine-binding chemotaxis protein CheW
MNGAQRLQFLCFRLADRLFAVDIMGIRELLRNQPVTPVPDAPEAICGVLNVRGELLTVLDIRRVLGVDGEEGKAKDKRIILARVGADRFGLLVDAVLDVLNVDVEEINPAPVAMGAQERAVLGMFRRVDGDGAEQVVMLVHLGYLARIAKGESDDGSK